MATPAAVENPVTTENPIAPASVSIDVKPEEPMKPAKGSGKAAPAKVYRGAEDRPDYKIVCCGNNCLDLFLIPMTAIVLYGALLGYGLLIVWATMISATSGVAHWIFFFAWFSGVVILGISVRVADYEKILKAKSVVSAEANGTNA
ncbi:unnamed protein product [Aphanomyces euteiches]|uniref:Uncharacterized protein n=1 Tax=Aphanomyces euteiches TaxID=100861 RepID=A0A6G0WYR7_9STRA|nr:hypothetical protein Ae201684_010362 [Aphanomyces euteiches]KAH9090296.1 hypothetical protein Ae201684P_014103 [Aphanomyces euteiches]KAH9154092.1 hypothetical protein AeRB84_003763 [Aphanomyces euteiches]